MGLVRVPPTLLREIAHGGNSTPTLYSHPNVLLRNAFWTRLKRIDALMGQIGVRGGRCLDFGGGGGVFLPTLAARFEHVDLIDRDTRDAAALIARLGLGNVRAIETDIREAELSPASYDVVVAADVLEHWPDLRPPLALIARWLKPSGLLFTSLPSENGFYRGLRRAFSVTAPEDHYHDAAAVERQIQTAGFRAVGRRPLPPGPTAIQLFSICAWRAPGAVT